MTVIDLTPLPTFASQTGSTLTINLNNIAAIAVGTSGSNVTVTESGSQNSFSGITSILVNGSATNNVLNFNGPMSMPFTFTNDGTTTLNVNSGILNFAGASTFNLGSMNIAAGAGAALPSASGSESQLTLNTLSIASGGSLDLNNNRLLINYGRGGGPDRCHRRLGSIRIQRRIVDRLGNLFHRRRGQPVVRMALAMPTRLMLEIPQVLAAGQIEVMYTLLGDARIWTLRGQWNRLRNSVHQFPIMPSAAGIRAISITMARPTAATSRRWHRTLIRARQYRGSRGRPASPNRRIDHFRNEPRWSRRHLSLTHSAQTQNAARRRKHH